MKLKYTEYRSKKSHSDLLSKINKDICAEDIISIEVETGEYKTYPNRRQIGWDEWDYGEPVLHTLWTAKIFYKG